MAETSMAPDVWMRVDDPATVGVEMYEFARRLYPICRSITGDGVRETLTVLGERIPLVLREVASGTVVFDWVVPKEWNIRDAYVKNSRGERVIDFQRSNLHVVNYSTPVQAKMRLPELRAHLHSLPEQPRWVPYRTSYYSENWGFCLAHEDLMALPDDEYEVCIDSTLQAGSLTYGEYALSGDSADEVVIYTHTCHPALANDNLSGLAVATWLARHVAAQPRRYSYRFIFGPGTIGSIAWLCRNEDRLNRIRHGLVVGLVGDSGPFTYKKSRRGDADIDRVAVRALHDGNQRWSTVDFEPYGYDERQFCSPGVNLPFGRLTRSANGSYPEYHTSADNLDFVTPQALAQSLETCLRILNILEKDRRYLNTSPKGEPQLGKRGLYRKSGGQKDVGQREYALLWVLNQSDGEHSLLDISERSGIAFETIHAAAQELAATGLLVSVETKQ